MVIVRRDLTRDPSFACLYEVSDLFEDALIALWLHGATVILDLLVQL